MRLRAHFAVIALFVLGVACGLAACGGDDDETTPAAAAASTTGHAMSGGMPTGVEVAEAIGSVYGDEAADTFLDGPSLWRDHISFLVDYTVALAKKDKTGQKEAVDNLIGYTGAFSGFLAQATGLPQAPLQEGVTEHVTQLKGSLDAYAAGRYDKVVQLTREAYEHMVMTGDTLADAIAAQHPEMFGG